MALTTSVDEIIQSSRNPLLSVRPHWKRIRLGEVASVLNGFAFKSAQFTKGDGMPLIRIRDVGSGSTDTNYVGEFDDRYIVEPGDLLIGMDGEFNCARWRGPRGLLNQRVCKVTLYGDQYHPRFLDFALPGYLKAINDATSSVTVKHLSSRTVEDIPLPFPPLHEQDEIVSELEKQFSRLDEAVANLKRVRANFKRYKAAVLKAAVEGRLVPTEANIARQESRSYEAGGQLLNRILEIRRSRWKGKGKYTEPASPTDSDALSLPEGWAAGSIGQLSLFSFYGPRFSSEIYADVGPFVLRTSDISESGRVDTTSAPRISLTPEEFSKYRIERGDLLVTRTGSLGTVALFDDQVDAIPGAYLIQFRLLLDRTTRQYLLLCLLSPRGQAYLTGAGAGVGRPNINAPKIEAFVIGLPPLAEQVRIVAEVDRRLSIVHEVEAEIDANLMRAQGLRQSVLGQVFGETRSV